MAELFETFDDDGRLVALVPRDEVHRTGAWHKSSQVFVFNSRSELLVQQRAPDKDLYAGLWDYSVGEHLQPGESHLEGARRGLAEELGIRDVEPRPLGSLRRIELVSDEATDREMQQAFAVRYDGIVQFEPCEVQRIEWCARGPLLEALERDPERFTPWFKQDVVELAIATEWDAILADLTGHEES